MNLPRFLAVACVILFLPLEVPAAHVDIRPYVSGGRIITGTSELNGAIVDPISDLARVFGAEFGEHDPLQPFFTDQPGFLSEAGQKAPRRHRSALKRQARHLAADTPAEGDALVPS